MARREGVEEIPADAWYTDVWKQEQTAAARRLNSEWFGWLVITHEPWPLTLCTNSWAIPKGLTWFGQWNDHK